MGIFQKKRKKTDWELRRDEMIAELDHCIAYNNATVAFYRGEIDYHPSWYPHLFAKQKRPPARHKSCDL